MKKILFYFILCIFLLTLASPIYSQSTINSCEVNTDCIIGEYVYNNTYSPYTSQICTVSITYPNNTQSISDETMTNNSDGFHNYTYIPSVIGYHRSEMNCINGTDYARIDKSFIVTSASISTINTSLTQLITTHDNTLNNIETKINNTYHVTLSGTTIVSNTESYDIAAISTQFNGTHINLTTNPTIIITDPNGTVMYSTIMNYIDIGIYIINYSIPDDSELGTWNTTILSEFNGVNVTSIDYWTLTSSLSVATIPADVIVHTITENIIPTMTALISITNMGDTGSDFEYIYCLVDNQTNDCGGGDDVDYVSATRYIYPGATWTSYVELSAPIIGVYWFKLKARALTEVSWATSSRQLEMVEVSATGQPISTELELSSIDISLFDINLKPLYQNISIDTPINIFCKYTDVNNKLIVNSTVNISIISPDLLINNLTVELLDNYTYVSYYIPEQVGVHEIICNGNKEGYYNISTNLEFMTHEKQISSSIISYSFFIFCSSILLFLILIIYFTYNYYKKRHNEIEDDIIS